MRRKLLCYGPLCYLKRIKHDRNELTKHGGRTRRGGKNYCDKCWKIVKKRRDNQNRLYYYIEDKASITFPTGMMRRDIKNYRKKYHYTYGGIYTALIYADKFCPNFRFRSSYFLHYVPFIYDKAQRWRYRRNQHDNLMLNVSHVDNQIEHAKVDRKVWVKPKKLPQYDMNKF